MRYTEVLILNILARQCHYCHCIMSKCMNTSLRTFCASSSLSTATQSVRPHWATNLAKVGQLPDQCNCVMQLTCTNMLRCNDYPTSRMAKCGQLITKDQS